MECLLLIAVIHKVFLSFFVTFRMFDRNLCGKQEQKEFAQIMTTTLFTLMVLTVAAFTSIVRMPRTPRLTLLETGRARSRQAKGLAGGAKDGTGDAFRVDTI